MENSMTLSPNTTARLEQLEADLQRVHKRSHRDHANDQMRATKMFMDIYRSGEQPHYDEIREWARDHGWNDEGARDLANDMETVFYTMKIRDGKTSLE